MRTELDTLQRLALNECDEWANKFSAVQGIFIFGSVGRGDYRIDSDLDLYIDIDSSKPLEHSQCLQDLAALQADLTRKSGHVVSLHYEPMDGDTDSASKAVKGPNAKIVASRGKAHLIAAPKTRRR